MTGIEAIAAERERQISVEGWTPEHDDAHRHDELSQAAICYAANKKEYGDYIDIEEYAYGSPEWPFLWRARDKRAQHDRLRSLAIAGALIAAEYDRLKRGEEA